MSQVLPPGFHHAHSMAQPAFAETQRFVQAAQILSEVPSRLLPSHYSLVLKRAAFV